MKTSGVVRKVDRLGRVVLPIELRRTLGIVEGDDIEMYLVNGTIALRKIEKACVFCGQEEALIDYLGKTICQTCLEKISEL